MYNFILILHVVVAIVLILAILVFQTSKGSALSMFGGGGDNLFSSNTGTSFVRKFTMGAAIIFGATSLFLTIFSSSLRMKSVVQEHPLQTAPPKAQTQDPGVVEKETAGKTKEKPVAKPVKK
ncbi:MAG: preprotein translocase subunit SecG [Elusimicrobia bacterium]|nr:preprotein translocase subunit SecG [Elusimicrobiota bacterium]